MEWDSFLPPLSSVFILSVYSLYLGSGVRRGDSEKLLEVFWAWAPGVFERPASCMWALPGSCEILTPLLLGQFSASERCCVSWRVGGFDGQREGQAWPWSSSAVSHELALNPGVFASCVEVGGWRRARRAHLIHLPQAELATWDVTSRSELTLHGSPASRKHGLPRLEESCDPSAGSANSTGLHTGCCMPELQSRLLSPRHNRGWQGGGCVICRHPPSHCSAAQG